MTGKDKIILQKVSTYIDDVAQYVDGFLSRTLWRIKRPFPPVPFQFPKLANWQRKSARIHSKCMTIYLGKVFEV